MQDRSARFVKVVSPTGMSSALYECDGGRLPRFVVVSSTVVDDVPETLIFEADSSGRVVDSFDLPGSQRGTLDHEVALSDAGYRVVYGVLN